MTPAVLVHGVGLDRHMWRPFQRCLEQCGHNTTYTYDLIGLGDAPKPEGPYNLSMYAQQLASVAAQVVPQGRADVVGFSLGALVAQRFALDFPDRVRRLVLVSSVFNRSTEERSAIAARVAEVRSGGYEATIEPALLRWFSPAFVGAQPDVVEEVRIRMRSNDVRSYTVAYEVFATGDVELAPLVEHIVCPTLVVTGEHDDMTRKLASRLPNARAEILPNARHLVPLEAPAALGDLVARFLAEADGKVQ
jgi:(E)-2-((N-methylformamido)methylene)succinate hydrolase